MNTIKHYRNIVVSFALVTWVISMVVLLNSCKKKDDPKPPENEEELITTVKLKVKNTLFSSDSTEVVWKDLDGNGGNPPSIGTLTLRANSFYSAQLALLDESHAGHTHNINDEINNEKAEHQFFYQATGNLSNFAYVDFDANGKPVGLRFSFQTGAAGSATLKITLRHKPNKSAPGVSSGDITNAGGSTDIEVTFPVTIQP
ncbi:MAG: type 1 periplasmic binding fold superfamily protein [Bacteroidia bacterium]|nr:type 1 periplasmic binding fold superfamily protein [Bacteroidia bacterium]MDW8347948.1 type 1 periplasmic binding fold superfamily protein [Bacteroidia bacterium]